MGATSDETRRRLLPKNGPQRTPILRLIFLDVVVLSPGLLDGMLLAFPGIALPQMDLDIDEASWFGSVSAIGTIFSFIISGLIIDKFGRRPTILLGVAPTCLGWLMIAVGSSTAVILTGRVLCGINGGIAFIGTVYVAECLVVNHTHLRNFFNTWGPIGISIGNLLCYVLGYLLPYRQVAAVASALAASIYVVVFCSIPESPQWLHRRGRFIEARGSESKLGIYQPALDNVFKPQTCSSTSLWRDGWRKDLQQLRRKDVYKPLCIVSGWLALIAFSGGPPTITYMVDMLKTRSEKTVYRELPSATLPLWSWIPGVYLSGSTHGPTASEYQFSVISGLCGFVATILTSSLITRVGMKLMFVSSTFGMMVALLAYGLSNFDIPHWQATLDVIHIVSIWLIVFFLAFGIITVAISVIAEMFPHDAKGFVSVPHIVMSVVTAVSVKLHLYLYLYLGSWLYFIYAFVNLVNIGYTMAFVPETVGKTLDEIQEGFLR